jgi:hypothetical protein
VGHNLAPGPFVYLTFCQSYEIFLSMEIKGLILVLGKGVQLSYMILKYLARYIRCPLLDLTTKQVDEMTRTFASVAQSNF